MSTLTRHVALAALMPALMIHSSPALSAEIPWRERLSRAEKLSAAGKSEEAAAAAQIALAGAEKDLGPENPEVGRVLARLSEFERASGFSSRLPDMERRLSTFKSKGFDVWLSLGDVLREEGRSLEAEGALKKALALKPDDPEAEYSLARVYDDMGRLKEEILLLKKGIEKRPRDYSLYFQLAGAYTLLGRRAEAQATFAQAKKINRFTADAYIDEGYFYMNSGKFVEAKKSFEDAVAVDTANPLGLHHMGSYYSHSRQYAEAEGYFRRAMEKLEADPGAKADDLAHTMLDLGRVLQAQGRLSEAEAFYLDGLKKARPGGGFQLWLIRSLAELYVSEGKSAQAEVVYKRAVDACRVRFKCSFVDGGVALIDLGRFYLGRGRRAEAEGMAQRAAAFCASVPVGQGRFGLLAYLSQLYAGLGDDAKNEALYARLLPLRRTMPLDPGLTWVEIGSADRAATLGRFHEAEDFCRRAIEILDHNGRLKEEADVLDKLAGVYGKDGKRAEAENAREQANSLRGRMVIGAAR